MTKAVDVKAGRKKETNGGKELMSSPFSTLSHHNHALAVWGPGQILDRARERLDFNLEDMLLIDSVPDPDLARLIYKGWLSD